MLDYIIPVRWIRVMEKIYNVWFAYFFQYIVRCYCKHFNSALLQYKSADNKCDAHLSMYV